MWQCTWLNFPSINHILSYWYLFGLKESCYSGMLHVALLCLSFTAVMNTLADSSSVTSVDRPVSTDTDTDVEPDDDQLAPRRLRSWAAPVSNNCTLCWFVHLLLYCSCCVACISQLMHRTWVWALKNGWQLVEPPWSRWWCHQVAVDDDDKGTR